MSTQDDDEFEKLLNEFISTQLEDVDTGLEEPKDELAPQPQRQQSSSDEANERNLDNDDDDEELSMLKDNEKALFKAWKNFNDCVVQIADDFKIKPSLEEPEPMRLFPNYKPSIGKEIAQSTIKGWEVMIKAYPEIIEKISPDASDEQLLDFAEKTDNDTLQFGLISYVEMLIEMEGCEIAYKERKLKKEKKKLERQIYEEHQRRINRINKYISALKEKAFPINAERLVKNYFKTAMRDAEGAFQAVTTNPAMFSPIEFDKIKPRFFGLIKVKPQDGIRFNRIIGEFIKKLKV